MMIVTLPSGFPVSKTIKMLKYEILKPTQNISVSTSLHKEGRRSFFVFLFNSGLSVTGGDNT